ncbi:MAG TPA: MerC family mercury resistance protein [Longimicrobium sp.]|nr:MerC family mercury resistance protein [Longimicrobium sp.]
MARTDAGSAAVGWAAAVPLLCAVHGLASPVLVMAAPALALGHGVEALVQAVSAALAGLMAWSGIRAHGRRAVLVPIVAGVVLWAAPGLVGWTGMMETAAHAAGGILLAGGMIWSARLRHDAACHHCGCPVHEH